jgi:hypothetical protein
VHEGLTVKLTSTATGLVTANCRSAFESRTKRGQRNNVVRLIV